MLLKNGLVLDENFQFKRLDISIKEGRIHEIATEIRPDKERRAADVLDLVGFVVVPGLVDIHVHGAGGEDYSNADMEGIEKIARQLARSGVTSFLAASLSLPHESLDQLYRVTERYIGIQKFQKGAASLLGIYMEGPYFSVNNKGSQDEACLRLPDYEEYEKLQILSGNNIKIVSVAPELPGAVDFIEKATKATAGATPVLSIGHSACSYDEAREAFAAGAGHITHLYNGMLPFHHRKPGIPGAFFDDQNATAELICDGLHVHPAAIRMAFRLVKQDRIILISDGLSPMGCRQDLGSAADFKFGRKKVYVKNGIATLEDGTPAGSVTGLLSCVRKAIEFGIEKESAIKAATINPARRIGMDKEIGSIAVGKRADLLILDRDLNLNSVYINGRQI